MTYPDQSLRNLARALARARSITSKSTRGIAVAAFVALITATASAQDYGNNKPPPIPEVGVPLTPEQKTALDAIDIRIAGVETLAAKIDDEKFKANTVATIADLKRRRASLAKKFDQMTYESLMHLVISRYQVVALWLTPPRVPEPAKK